MEVRRPLVVVAAPGLVGGGMEVLAVEQARHLLERGWRVQLLTTVEAGDSQGLPCHDLSGQALSIGKVRRFAAYVNGLHPAAVLSHDCSLLHHALPLLEPAIKPVVVLHRDDLPCVQTASLFARRIFRWVAPVPAVADLCRGVLRARDRGRVRLVPTGVCAELFGVDGQVARGPGRNLAFVGIVNPAKGAHLLPDMLKALRDRVSDVHLHIAGRGLLDGELAQQFETLGLADAVTWHGRLPRLQVAALLQRSDALVLPTGSEAFALVLAEAMLCGCVPVVTRLSGTTDAVVDHGRTGLLVDARTAEAFAAELAPLLNAPDRLRSMRQAAAAHARRYYRADRMIDAYEALLREDDDREPVRRLGTGRWLAELAAELLTNPALAGRRGDWLRNGTRRLVARDRSPSDG